MGDRYSKAYLLGIIDLLVNAVNYPLPAALALTLDAAGIGEKDIAGVRDAIRNHPEIEQMFEQYRDKI